MGVALAATLGAALAAALAAVDGAATEGATLAGAAGVGLAPLEHAASASPSTVTSAANRRVVCIASSSSTRPPGAGRALHAVSAARPHSAVGRDYRPNRRPGQRWSAPRAPIIGG